jgi:rhomboid protease GluP
MDSVSQPLTLRTDAGDELLDLPDFEARVRRGEVSPQSLVCFPAVTGRKFIPACELEIYRGLHRPSHAYFTRSFSFTRFPWVTSLVIGLNLAVYVFSVREGPLDLDAMVRFGAKVGPLITDLGEVWRLLTANFLHQGALHIGLNMFVLFNVGGALENAYRKLDYIFLLIFSGVSTMSVSLFLSDGVSVGASGMVYGCLGGIVVFGLKYRAILPSRYKRLLGEAAIPTVLLFLWIGWTSVGVDNSAHLGGLLAGLGIAPFLQPKLLEERPVRRFVGMLRIVPSLVLVGLAVWGQELFAARFPRLLIRRDDGFGISMPVPRSWRRGANRLGQLAYYNGLPGTGRATFAAEALTSDEPADAAEQARRFVDEGLVPQALGPDVLKVVASPPESVIVAGHSALMVPAVIEEPFGKSKLLAYFVPRGEIVYQLVFSYSADFPKYAKVISAMVGGLRFDEPKGLREARARALLFPYSPWALGVLGETLRRLGKPASASDVLDEAVKREPESAPLRTQLALSLMQAEKLEAGCEAAHAAVVYSPQDARALEASARCELLRGNPEKALTRVREARVFAPADERLKQAEARLKAMVAQSSRSATPIRTQDP